MESLAGFCFLGILHLNWLLHSGQSVAKTICGMTNDPRPLLRGDWWGLLEALTLSSAGSHFLNEQSALALAFFPLLLLSSKPVS
jgi:hypothetical protein